MRVGALIDFISATLLFAAAVSSPAQSPRKHPASEPLGGLVAIRSAHMPPALSWLPRQRDSMAQLLVAQVPALAREDAAVLLLSPLNQTFLMRPWYDLVARHHIRRQGPIYLLWRSRPPIWPQIFHPSVGVNTRTMADVPFRYCPDGGHPHLLLVIHAGKITHALPLSVDVLENPLPYWLYEALHPENQDFLDKYKF